MTAGPGSVPPEHPDDPEVVEDPGPVVDGGADAGEVLDAHLRATALRHALDAGEVLPRSLDAFLS